MDLSVKIYGFEIAGVEVWITETIFNTWLIMLFLIGLAVIARIKLRKFKTIPTGFQNVIEAVSRSLITLPAALGKTCISRPGFYGFYVYLIIQFVQCFRLRARPDWITTFALAFATFTLMLAMGSNIAKVTI